MPPKRKRKAATADAPAPASKQPKAKKPKPSTTSMETKELNNSHPVVYIEHCRSWNVFKRRANEVFTKLIEELPKENLQLVLNPGGTCRRGAFEISIAKTPSDDEKSRKLIWTGLKKGPPRAQKFPEVEDILDELKTALE